MSCTEGTCRTSSVLMRRRNWQGCRLLCSCAMAAVCCLAAVDTSRDPPAETAAALAKKAKRAAKNGKSAQAFLWYSEAAALQPKNRRYKARMEALQARAAEESRPELRGGAAPASLSEE